MPTHYHKDDRQWIHSMISPLHPDERYKVCKAYTRVFNEAADNEPLRHRKDGKARFAANCQLRVYMKNKTNIFK